MTKYTIIICDDVRQANNLSLKVGIALSMVRYQRIIWILIMKLEK